MKNMKAVAILAAVLAAADVFAASPTATLLKTRLKASAAVVPGRWHAGYSKCLDYAKKNKVPLIAVWSNGDACGHCVIFETVVNRAAFKKWMAESGCVFYFIYSGDHGDGDVGSKVFHWCRKNKNTAYPFVRIYWPAGGVDIATVGDTVDGVDSSSKGTTKAINYFKSKLKNFKPVAPTPAYTGGGFNFPDSEQARIEAEAGVTTSVTLPLSRDSKLAADVATNLVVATYPNGTVVTNTVIWDSGDTEASVVLDTSSLANAGEQIELTLLDAAGAEKGTSHVTATKTENSTKNPFFVGEKMVDELGWGEWTMDIDVATSKVAQANSASSGSSGLNRGGVKPLSVAKAHTLVLAGGSLWCPDCSAADRNFFDDQRFKDWARDNKVALVTLDIPNLPNTNTSPCLLTKVVYNTSDRYVTANFTPGYSNEALRVQSGIGYLSRHMVSDEQAAKVLARNIDILGKNTLDGGWNLPERLNQNRIGVPSLIVLREDGTIAGRFSRYSDVGPQEFEPGVLTRLAEIFDEADKSAEDRAKDVEEKNDSWTSTTEMVGMRQKVEDHTVSFTDSQDVFKLDPDTTNGKRLKFSLTGDKAVQMEIKVLDDLGTVKASTNGMLNAGVTLDWDIPAPNWYVQIGSYKTLDAKGYNYPADAYFAHTSDSSTVAAYTLSTDFVVIPKEVQESVTISDPSEGITMALVSNETYRIVGIPRDANLDVLEPIGADDLYLYRALVTDSVKLNVANPVIVYYQLWHPGKVGFATASAVASEPEGSPQKKPFVTYRIRIVRKDGVSGIAAAKVTFDAVKSSGLDELIELPDDFSDTLTWSEGESDDKYLTLKILNNPYADGDQTLYFDLKPLADTEAGINRLRLTLRDNDPKRPGKVAIVSTDPAIAEGREAYARAGDTIKINVGRVDGSDGEAKATISASAGTLDTPELSWPRRVSTDQTVSLALPDAKGSKINVEMVPAKGTSVDSNRRKLTVKLLDANVPGFEDSAVEIDAVRYVPILPERRIRLDEKADADAKVKLTAGKLIAGLKWRFENKKLVIYGTPTKAGSSTARFRVYNGKTGGLATEVTVHVTDPVTSGGGDGSEPLNPAVAKARTFTDVPVITTTTSNLVGTLTLTLPRSGRASAKYRMAEGTVTLSCDSWCGMNETDGTLLAALTGKFKGEEFGLAVDAMADGGVIATLSDPLHGAVECLTEGNVWSKTNKAADFRGYYTVSMPVKAVDSGTSLALGAGYMTLKMNATTAINAGKFAYAGVYPNGRPFSGSVLLTPLIWDNSVPSNSYWRVGVLPIITSGSDALFGALRIMPGAADPAAGDTSADGTFCQGRCYYQSIRRSVHPVADTGLRWSHSDAATNVSCKAWLDAFGTYYVSTEDFVNCCKSALKTDKLSFFSVGGEALDPELEGDLKAGALKAGGALAVASKTINVTHTAKTKKKAASNAIKFVPAKDKKKKAINPNALSLSFTLSSGIVSGSFKLPLEDGGTVTATYKGVVMPGWGSEECTDCGMGGSEAKLRPFVSGTAWFNDTLEYDDEKGRDRKATVRRSVPFSIGNESGK